VDGYDALVRPVVYVASHGCSFGYVLDMVGHDPNIFKIPAWLHARNRVNPTVGANLGHLEDKEFVRLVTLSQEYIALDIGPSADTSKFRDAIHNS
jgi:hypothetical protein